MQSQPCANIQHLLSIIIIFARPIYAIQRYIGLSSDHIAQDAVQQCFSQANSTYRMSFDYGECPVLVRCVLTTLPADWTAGMQSGANIASLVPTILAIVGSAPLNLVQLSFMAPHRALATCMFGVGLPSGLFRQLQVHLPHLADQKTTEPRIRQWIIPIPRERQKGFRRVMKTLTIDALILALASLMLWRNVAVGLQTTVTWRCEYSWLLICWPITCILWLVIAIALLQLLSENIEITYSEDSSGLLRKRRELLLLPYLTPSARKATNDTELAPLSPSSQQPQVLHPKVPSSQVSPKPEPHFSVTIKMRHNSNWAWYESTIEALAVGIFLYATFVLTSSLFLTGEQAILYASVMILCMSTIKLLESVR